MNKLKLFLRLFKNVFDIFGIFMVNYFLALMWSRIYWSTAFSRLKLGYDQYNFWTTQKIWCNSVPTPHPHITSFVSNCCEQNIFDNNYLSPFSCVSKIDTNVAPNKYVHMKSYDVCRADNSDERVQNKSFYLYSILITFQA